MNDNRAPELHVDYFGLEHNQEHADVFTWQAEMAWRGWEIDSDQVFGPQSGKVCRRFQAAKSLELDGLVGPDTWDATWNTPVDAAELYAMRDAGLEVL